MKSIQLYLIIIAALFIVGCGVKKPYHDSSGRPITQGDPQNAQSFGYQPLDPLPVKIVNDYKHTTDSARAIAYNTRVMNSLPDETMRLAIGKVDLNSNISFGTANIGYEGNRYLVILDYIKFDTKSCPTKIVSTTGQNKSVRGAVADTISFIPAFETYARPDAVIPVYVGVGLRLTATLEVKSGTVDLGNLIAIGAAAEAKQVAGTLIIQTLGISGENISSIIPMPNEINTTTIQNAIMALSSIRAKIYQKDVRVTPRIVGFYNNVGGGRATANEFISTFLSNEHVTIEHHIAD